MSEKPCQCCGRDHEAAGNECLLCAAVLLSVVFIRDHWEVSQFTELCKLLRTETLRAFVEISKNRGASTCVRLGRMLQRLQWLSGADEMTYLCALLSRLHADAGELAGLMQTEGGAVAWRLRCATYIQQHLRAAVVGLPVVKRVKAL